LPFPSFYSPVKIRFFFLSRDDFIFFSPQPHQQHITSDQTLFHTRLVSPFNFQHHGAR
jgi:hypothetical protein